MASGLFTLKQVNQAISQGAWSGYIAPKWVEYLVVAGGGSGASSGGTGGSGGGAGGLLTGIVTVTAGTSYTVTVGAGGAAGTADANIGNTGVNSVFGNITALGGGKGGTNSDNLTGGSGGGGTYLGNAGGQGTSGQGNAGGRGSSIAGVGGGGGGAGTKGGDGNNHTVGGPHIGGAGIASAISGTVVAYAGGGGGGSNNTANTGGTGGVGGGGNGAGPSGASVQSGIVNTGGGGGGIGQAAISGAGGSGIVIVRYPGTVQFYTGGTVTYSNGYIVHNFTANGTLTPTTPTVVATDYQISRSLRFNNPTDTAYLNRTPATTTNRTTFTFSVWVKRGAVDTNYRTLFSNANAVDYILFWDTTGLSVQNLAGNYQVITTQVFRDPSAWYHLVVAMDTTQATSSDRIKIYVNGVQVTAFSTSTYPPQNFNTGYNTATAQYIGWNEYNYYNGYMTEVNFIDGQALPPTSFGYVSPTTGIWSPAKYVGAYGTNGFYLNFSDNSNTTAATLGKDYSGNNNNWTPNNFSVTAGAGNDSLVDSPTSYGTDTGVGGTVRGNYCTWNPLSARATTLTNGNLDGSTASGMAAGTIGVSSGKWYWECTPTDTTAQQVFGIISTSNTSFPTYPGGSADSYGYYGVSGNKYNNNASVGYGSTFGNNDVIGVALDLDAGTLTFYKNNTSQGVAFSSLSGTFAPAAGDGATNAWTANFGQRPFAYTAPSGFKALCTQNLPTPAIGSTSATLATQFFAPVIYTGNGTTQVVTVGFQPDFVWNKCRNTGFNHYLEDSVRGVNKPLRSGLTGAETTETDAVMSFNTSGFTTGGNAATNNANATYVAWNWRASNATAVTNTAGSITSTVSANTTSGFSIVTYTGQSAAGTVGHGLGVAPSMIIVKSRSNGAYGWAVWHSSFTQSEYLLLETTDAKGTASNYWNSSSPSTWSSAFGVGSGPKYNNNTGDTFVAYCFAEIAGYSKFGSYTGNGSSDGTFVHTGFRPALILFKRSSSAGNSWRITDSTRSTYNLNSTAFLYPDVPNVENEFINDGLDILSNGFKLRVGNDPNNASGSTYIYMAFAESPFKYSLAR